MIERVIGKRLTTPAGAATVNSSVPHDKADGEVIGISVNAPYADDVLSLMFLSVKQGSNKQIESIPLFNLKPIAGQLYVPLKDKITYGKIEYTLESLSATSAASKPVVLLLHCVNIE